jgi:hypothetical protein
MTRWIPWRISRCRKCGVHVGALEWLCRVCEAEEEASEDE